MGVSGPQVSLPDPKSPALGRLMSWDAWPGAGQQRWAEGGPTHLLAPQVQSAQGQQGRGLPAGRAEESSGTKWAPWRMAERAALHFHAGLMGAAPIRPRAPLRRAMALPGPSHRAVRCPASPVPPLAPTPVQDRPGHQTIES